MTFFFLNAFAIIQFVKRILKSESVLALTGRIGAVLAVFALMTCRAETVEGALPEGPLEVRWYPYRPVIYYPQYTVDPEWEKLTPEQRADREKQFERKRAESLKKLFSEACGVTWPAGSSAVDVKSEHLYRICNTRAALEAIEAWFVDSDACEFFELDLQLVRLTPEALEAVGWNDLKRPDAETLWSRLRRREDVTILAAPRFRLTLSNREAQTKGVLGITCPWGYRLQPCGGKTVVAEPDCLSYKEAGVSVDARVESWKEDDGDEFELYLDLKVSSLLGWSDVRQALPRLVREDRPPKMLTPDVREASVKNSFRVRSGKLFVLGPTEDVLIFGRGAKKTMKGQK